MCVDYSTIFWSITADLLSQALQPVRLGTVGELLSQAELAQTPSRISTKPALGIGYFSFPFRSLVDRIHLVAEICRISGSSKAHLLGVHLPDLL